MTNENVPKTATLTLGDQTIELPVLVGTEGEVAIDIRKLRGETGAITFDGGALPNGASNDDLAFYLRAHDTGALYNIDFINFGSWDGDSYPVNLVSDNPRYDGAVEQATESEIMEECARADRTGLFNCPHTGVALVALRKLQARGLIRSSDQVVVISTAHGLKFVDSKLAYHSMKLEGIVSERPNPPIELAADYQVVRDRMLREIDRRFKI